MATVLGQFSNALGDTVEQASPAVARVDARERLPASGVIWQPGIVITAHHVVERDDNLTVGLANGATVSAALAGRDPATDLAILLADTGNLEAPNWAEPDGLKAGHLVLALGRPSQSVRATLGVVHALGPSWRTPSGGTLDSYLQTDATMYPGFSGGPLVDAAGRILGVNTSALLRGASLAIPTPTVRRVAAELLAHGRVRRGWLGVGLQPIRLPEAVANQLGQETAILLTSVEPGSPAERSGLFMGDTIVALNGQPVRYPDDLLAQLTGERVGERVLARIVRGGQLQEITVTVGERP